MGKILKNLEKIVIGGLSLFLCSQAPGQNNLPKIQNANFQTTKQYVDSSSIKYTTNRVNISGGFEDRLYFNGHHFTSLINKNGTFIARTHSGLDLNGWGTSDYLQPYLGPEGTLSYSGVKSITNLSDRISVTATGKVSNGTSKTFGDWDMNLDFTYNPTSKTVKASGIYNIRIPVSLATTNLDLNLIKRASNTLKNVPRLDGTVGNTGDLLFIDPSSSNSIWALNDIWYPTTWGHYPTDVTDFLKISFVTTNMYDVDALKQGYAPIQAAYKPNVSVSLGCRNGDYNLSMGLSYNMAQNNFWSDNIGAMFIVKSTTTTKTNFSYDINLESQALPQDGIGMDCNINATASSNSTGYLEAYYKSSLNDTGALNRIIGQLPRSTGTNFEGTVSIPSLTGTNSNMGFIILKNQ